MDTKSLVKVLRCWHIIDGVLYCPQCWGLYLAQFKDNTPIKRDASDGNRKWARVWPVCEMCKRDARKQVIEV